VLSCDLSLITIHIWDCRQFYDIHISQGSVAKYLRRGGIFKYEFVANLPVNLSEKEVLKICLTFAEVMAKRLVSCFFTHNVFTGWLKIKYPTGEYAISPQPVVCF